MVAGNHYKTENQKAKKRLIKEATSLFAEKGYSATSVREIVERAGVTKPVLYYYFKNKEGMFYAILEEAYADLSDLLNRQLAFKGSFFEKTIEFSHCFYDLVMANTELNRMIHTSLFGPPKGAPIFDFERYHIRIVDFFKTIYEEGRVKGEVKESDPEEIALLVTSLIFSCMNQGCIQPDTADPERVARLLRMTFNGLENKNHLKRNISGT